ncbi:Uncharacterised protein [Mycobacteroides abscessus subsp. abscessus]|nr:Uncharacterised protein [Mycobacteroides abscessus subsp. abscessus]
MRLSTTTACPPNCAIPISNENRVRVEFFSKMTATPCGPSSGRRENGAFLSSAANVRTSACSAGERSSSLKKWRSDFD